MRTGLLGARARLRHFCLVVVLGCLFFPTAAPRALAQEPPPQAPPARPSSAEVVIEGKGWGHGVGMAQDGAYAMGAAGASTADILNHFYPGTSVGSASGQVRVEVMGASPAVLVAFPGGGEVRDADSGTQSPGFPVAVIPGGSVHLSFTGGAFRARPVSGATLGPFPRGSAPTAAAAPAPAPAPGAPAAPTTTVPNLLGIPLGPVPTTTPPTAAPAPAGGAPPAGAAPAPGEAASTRGLVAFPAGESTIALPARDRRYRGIMRATAAGGGLRLLNELDVEQYLKGMGEVRDPGWPAASLRAQAIAARTYALRAMAGGGEICDTQQCQVYLGQAVEYAAMNKAVADSRGQVVRHGGSLALTVYSANGGGFSATPEEGWGGDSGGSYPYLRAAPYRTTNPDPWTVRVGLDQLAGRFGFSGRALTARVSRAGPSGRALEVVFEGPDAKTTAVEGRRFASEMNLRSNFFTLRVEAPAPVPEGATAAAGSDLATAPAASANGIALFDAAEQKNPMGRLPWIALALLLLVAVNGARQTLLANGRLGRGWKRESRPQEGASPTRPLTRLRPLARPLRMARR